LEHLWYEKEKTDMGIERGGGERERENKPVLDTYLLYVSSQNLMENW
jgi:hypothetical protein